MTRPILFGDVEKSNLKSIDSYELSLPIAKCSGMCVSLTSIRLSFQEIKGMKETTNLIINTVSYQVRLKESFISHIINQFLHCVVSLVRNNYLYSVLIMRSMISMIF